MSSTRSANARSKNLDATVLTCCPTTHVGMPRRRCVVRSDLRQVLCATDDCLAFQTLTNPGRIAAGPSGSTDLRSRTQGRVASPATWDARHRTGTARGSPRRSVVSGFDVDRLALRSHVPPVHGEALQRKLDALARAPASKRGSWDARPLASYSGEVLAMNESKFRDAARLW